MNNRFIRTESLSTRTIPSATSEHDIRRVVEKSLLAITGVWLTAMSISVSSAACKGINCVCKPSVLQYQIPDLAKNEDGNYPISLEADDVQAQGQDVVTLSGDAEVRQGQQAIVADTLQYYRQTERVVASGNVEMISDNGDYLASEAIDVHVPTQIGTLTNSEFKLSQGLSVEGNIASASIESRGSADLVNLEGEGVVRLNNARYTTCAEGDDSVVVGASELELDRLAGIGRARGATVRFKGVPILYLPKLTFPLNDQRKTGFLTPGFGSDEESGNILEFPWYWNIAKNQDATITPRYFSDRGTQIGVEYRLDTPRSSTRIFGEYLPDDDVYASELMRANINAGNPNAEIDADRSLITINHSQRFTDNLFGNINYNDLSDSEYYDDLRNDVRYISASYVPRDVELGYSHEYFQVGVRASEYQVIDPDISSRFAPYERVPSVLFRTQLPEGPYGLRYGLSGSYTKFDTDAANRDKGTRTALNPYIELPLDNIWGYVKPRVSLYTRSYSLEDVAADREDSPSFTVPIFSIDSGVVFERNASWFGDKALQTLEPRVYYVYAPEEDQDDVPRFDTAQVSLNNFSNIYRENRFFGEDRVGDTNQVTFGVTSRILDSESGDERMRASVGQLVLLDDLEQGLAANSPKIEKGLGDFLAELSTRSKDAWTTRTFIQYDHDESEIRTAYFAFGYQPSDDNRKKVDLSYYRSNFRSNIVDQLVLDASWPVSDRWQVFGQERYSIEDSKSLMTTLGVEYNACCWKVRIIGTERFQNRDIEDSKTSVMLELELTTLGSIRTGL